MDNTTCAPACPIRPLSDSAPCGWGLYEYPLAMVYAPLQAFRSLYDPKTALQKGTLFAELDLPLESVTRGGCGCRSNGNSSSSNNSTGREGRA